MKVPKFIVEVESQDDYGYGTTTYPIMVFRESDLPAIVNERSEYGQVKIYKIKAELVKKGKKK